MMVLTAPADQDMVVTDVLITAEAGQKGALALGGWNPRSVTGVRATTYIVQPVSHRFRAVFGSRRVRI